MHWILLGGVLVALSFGAYIANRKRNEEYEGLKKLYGEETAKKIMQQRG